MDELQSLRRDIDAIDRQLVELFRQRMDVTHQVGEYKRAQGIPVLDQERERQVLQNKGELAGEALRPAVITLYQTIMALSRRQQRDLMGQGPDNPGIRRWREAQSARRSPIPAPRVVYQGVPGAYSEQASVNFFGGDVNTTGLEQFEDCFAALREGRADYAVLPIENSSTGAIRQIYDLLTQYEQTFDLSAVKEAATAAGMTQPSDSQVYYISLPGEDQATVYQDAEGPLEKCFAALNRGIHAVAEYFH